MKKAFSFIILFILAVASVTFMGCEKKEDTDEFALLISQITEIDKLAEEYFEDYQLINTLRYIRGTRYNDILWNSLGGPPNIEFEQYVNNNQSKDSESIRRIESIIIPNTGDEVDFVHMIATMNFALINQDLSDLGGYAGDIAQLVGDIMYISGDFDEVYNTAKTHFGAAGGFDYPDVFANIDAVNMAKRYLVQPQKLSELIEDYYNELTHFDRIQEYLVNDFGKLDFEQSELRDIVHQRVIKNAYIKILFATEKISMTAYADHIKACCYVYADYLLGLL